ncbi:MAG: leucine-rich repeat protein, partial [Treponema sp.]|nr:leucine-rich repeat protein [Treponema sp.]
NVDTAADSKPADPTKTGATFLGWYTGTVSGSGATATVTYASTAYNFTTKVTSNITLYAKWGLDISGLSGYLASLPPGSKEEPNVLPAINGLTTSNWTQIKTALTANSSKFVDLSATALPAGITTMEEGFKNCSKLVAAPAIPDSVTNMKYCFSYCSSLTAAPVIPDGVTDMYNCFYQCGSLTAAPAIPDGVTDMSRCFYGCSSLTAAPTIPDGVTNMRYCFDGCSSMTTGPSTIPSGVTDMSYCFRDCSSLTGVIVINAEITDSYNWYGTFVGLHSSLTVKVKSNVLNAVLEGTRLESPYEYPVCNINGMD